MSIRRKSVSLFIVAIVTSLTTLGAPAETALGGGGCRGRPSTEGTGTSIEMRETCFQPTVLHVEAGAKVTWTNSDPAAHSVAGATLEWGNYTTLSQSASVSYTFERPGTFPYYCFEHNGMIGAIVVGDGRGSGAGQAVQPAAPPAPSPSSEPTVNAAETKGDPRGSFAGWQSLVIAALLGLVGGGTGMALARVRR